MIILTIVPLLGVAQDGHFPLGARNTALSGTRYGHSDGWTLFNSLGAMADAEQTMFITSYQNRFGLPELQTLGGGMLWHQPKFNTGLKYFKFGDRAYNQQLLGLSAANRFQMVGFGVGINLVQTHVEHWQTIQHFTLQAGFQAQLSEHITIGADVFNIGNAPERPLVMQAGCSIRPITSTRLNVELARSIQLGNRLMAALEYQLIERVFVRTGLHLQYARHFRSQARSTFGFGLLPGAFALDYAFASGYGLGDIHEISLTRHFRKK